MHKENQYIKTVNMASKKVLILVLLISLSCEPNLLTFNLSHFHYILIILYNLIDAHVFFVLEHRCHFKYQVQFFLQRKSLSDLGF